MRGIPEMLHQAVLAAPGEDLPRLAPADWLEENADPRRAEVVGL
jgi:uncharacterized protein (TIGR02996 family)